MADDRLAFPRELHAATVKRMRFEQAMEDCFKHKHDFTPSPGTQGVPFKVASWHEALEHIEVDVPFKELWEKKLVSLGPKERVDYPETENQCYGWYSQPLLEPPREEERGTLHFPARYSEISLHGAETEKLVRAKLYEKR